MKALHEHVLSSYDVKLVGTESEVRRYRVDVAGIAAELASCRDLLAEAVGWIGDPSAYYGTQDAKDFDARVEAELAKRSTSAQAKPDGT